jgi:exopolysaccharide biosynthesis polyprenyl glycosylphosphotransferase
VSAAEIGPSGMDAAAPQPVPYVGYHDLIGQRGWAASPRDATRRRMLVCADLLALGAAFVATGFASADGRRMYPMLALLPLWIVLNKLLGLYDRDAIAIDKSALHELPRIVESLAIGGGLICLLAPVAGVAASRGRAVEFVAIAGALTLCLRTGVRAGIVRAYGPERTVIVGSGYVAKLLVHKLRTHPRYGVEVVGYIDISPDDDAPEPGDLPLLGELGCFSEICRDERVQRVLVAFSALDHEHLLDTIRASNALGLKLSIVPRLFEVLGRSMLVDEVEGMSLLSVQGIVRTRFELSAKRAIDIVLAALGLVVLAPLLVAIAVAIKLTSRGPMLFSQVRMGRGNSPFRMLKFRTMVDGADQLKSELAHLNEAQHPMFKIASDPRVTRIGWLLRRTSLDELPQLWNVVRGQMSLVGPRPLVPAEDAQVIGWYRARLQLAPGLTGPWQVMGRTEIPFQEMVKLDYRYVADWSLWNDLKLLLLTVPVVLRREGL